MKFVEVIPFETTDDVVWTGGDGKARCARHPYVCLIKASIIWPEVLEGVGKHVCAQCMREER